VKKTSISKSKRHQQWDNLQQWLYGTGIVEGDGEVIEQLCKNVYQLLMVNDCR
jgi:hypothetical protein